MNKFGKVPQSKASRRKMRSMFLHASAVALVGLSLIILETIHVSAQEYRGSLFGNVTDVAGALIPDATITIKNKATNIVETVKSSNRGVYTALNLNAGMYTVTVTAQGFATLLEENVEVRTGERLGLDLKLKVGAVADSVLVTSEPAQLITDTGSGSTIFSQGIVNSLPSLGGNVFSLIQTTAGSSHAGAWPDHTSERPFDNGGMDAYSMNGAPYGGNNNAYLIDGSPDNSNEGLGFVPPVDAVNQVNVITNGYDAELGRTGGGVTSVALKNGTNVYHGDVYANIRNNHIGAQLYQNYGQVPQVTQWSEVGFFVGGPISIPKLFSGRDKAFFAVSYEHFFDKLPASDSWSVPTVSQAQGNFCSGAPGNSNIGTVIYDPTTNPRTAFGGCPPGQGGSIIPANRLDPVMVKILSLSAQPNVAGCSNALAVGCSTNFISSYKNADTYHAETARVDYNFTQNEKFFATYLNNNRLNYTGNPGQVSAETALIYPIYNTVRINHGASANLTSIISPTLTSTARINWLRHDGLGRLSQEGSATGLGFSSALVSLFGNNNYPGISTTSSTQGYTSMSLAGGIDSTTLSDTWSAQETLNKVLSAHSIKSGGGLTTLLQNSQAASAIPTLTFSDVFTRQNYLQTSSTGDPLASALLGYPYSVSYTNPFRGSYKTTYVNAFVQDDWRVNKKLTVNLGLRWDVQTPPHERYNRAVIGFDPGAPSFVAGVNTQVGATNGGGGQYLGGLLFADPTNRSPYASYYRGFAPRFGFAYNAEKKLVVRGGWGRFFDYVTAYYFPPSTGFQSTSSAPVTSDNYQTPTLCAAISGCAVPSGNPLAGLAANGYASLFPAGIVPFAGSSLGAKTGAGTAIQFMDPNLKPTYVDQFNLAIAYQLPFRTVVEAAYVGSRSNNVQASSKSIDQLTAAQYTSLGATVNNAVANPFAGMLPGTTVNGATVAERQLLLPFPQYTNVTEIDLSVGKLWYNALQVKLEKRLTHGLSGLANFTWSRNLGATSWLNPNFDSITDLTRQPVSIEQPFFTNLILAYTEPFFQNGSRLLQEVLSGWTVAGNAQFQVGSLISTPTPGTVLWTGVDPSKKIAGVFQGRTLSRWFNNCVADAAGATIIASSVAAGCPASTPASDAPWRLPNVNGVPNTFVLNNVPTFFEGLRTTRPAFANMSVFKAFPIHESMNLELRVDAFNLTNTPWFGYGDNGAGITTSATSTSFGSMIKAQGNDPRILQIAGRINF